MSGIVVKNLTDVEIAEEAMKPEPEELPY